MTYYSKVNFEDHRIDMEACYYDVNLFNRHMQNCFEGILFHKVLAWRWGEGM
jgi:hypothetical protein